MGDCGLKDGDDLYGVFLPHNIWAVYADRMTLETAEILGKTSDVPEVKSIYETALNDLLQAMDVTLPFSNDPGARMARSSRFLRPVW